MPVLNRRFQELNLLKVGAVAVVVALLATVTALKLRLQTDSSASPPAICGGGAGLPL